MKVLGIDTATNLSSVALMESRQLVASAARMGARGHDGFLIPAVDFCFDQAGWRPEDLDAVVVDVGPGLFTGLRVGIASAQGMATMLGVPILGVSSLDALALRATTRHRYIWSVVDVRRGEVAVAGYLPVPGGAALDALPELVDYKQFRGILESDDRQILVVGDWKALPGFVLRGLRGVATGIPRYPAAEALIELAWSKAERGEFYHPNEVRPLYMREPDVTLGSAHLREGGLWE